MISAEDDRRAERELTMRERRRCWRIHAAISV